MMLAHDVKFSSKKYRLELRENHILLGFSKVQTMITHIQLRCTVLSAVARENTMVETNPK